MSAVVAAVREIVVAGELMASKLGAGWAPGLLSTERGWSVVASSVGHAFEQTKWPRGVLSEGEIAKLGSACETLCKSAPNREGFAAASGALEKMGFKKGPQAGGESVIHPLPSVLDFDRAALAAEHAAAAKAAAPKIDFVKARGAGSSEAAPVAPRPSR